MGDHVAETTKKLLQVASEQGEKKSLRQGHSEWLCLVGTPCLDDVVLAIS
jgi:hypothetical protein